MDLIIAGIIQDQDYFNELVKPHLNQSSIQYIGPVNPVQRDSLLKESYAVIHLNLIPERFGLVMAESMAAGVPRAVGCIRRLVSYGSFEIIHTVSYLCERKAIIPAPGCVG